MKKKNVLALIMALMMCLTLIPSYALAADKITLSVVDATPGDNGHTSSNLVDGDKTTSWGMNWWNGTKTAYAIIKTSRQIAAVGYALTTGEDAQSYINRNPRDWKLYGCNDYDESSKTGGSWTLLSSVENDNILQDINSESYNYYFDNYTYYKYYKFEITANKGNSFLKVGELELFDASMKQISFQAVDGKQANKTEENYTNLFDGKKALGNYTKYCVEMGDVYVVAKASDPIVVTGYTFTTGNDNAKSDARGRNPKSWVLYGSNDYNEATKQGTWTEIDSVQNDTTMKDVNYTPYSFACGNDKAFKYYKFKFNENQGSGVMQLCEIEFEYTTDIHKWQINERKEPDCTEAGYIKQTCEDCGVEQTMEIPALGHNLEVVSVTEEPTCSKVGQSLQKCSRCGTELIVELPIIDHIWQETSKTAATCFDYGELTEKCTMCNTERKSVLPPLGHSKGDDGKCKNCGKEIIKVGDTLYCDLQEAVNAATQEQVEILQDIAIDYTLSIDKECIIELNGNTIKQIGNSRLINVNKTLTLKDSSESRTGTISGGAISGEDKPCGGVYVNKGAVFNMQGVTVSDCRAKGDGGGILNYGTAEIRDSKIINCKSVYSGGGIYTEKGTLDLYNCIIENCSADMNGGGGIGANSATVTVYDNTVIRKNKATENPAYNYGAGVFATQGSTVTINNSRIEENISHKGAGILANTDSKIILNGSAVSGNNANADGGGIVLETASLTIENSSIINNTSGGNGGGIYANNNSCINFSGGNIDENSAEWGGGVYLHNGSDMTISGESNINSNTAVNNGGGIIINDAKGENYPTLTMTGGSIGFNKAIDGNGNDKGNGGGICGQKKAVINITGGRIENNNSINGGGIALLSESALSLSGADISGNNARSNGGGVYIDGKSNMNFSGGRVAQNDAGSLGGGIYVDGTISVSKIPQTSYNHIVSEDETGKKSIGSNIHLPAGKTITVDGEGLMAMMTDTGEISPILYVTAEKGTAAVTGACSESNRQYILSDNQDYAAIHEDGVIKFVNGYKVTFVHDTEDRRITTVVPGDAIAEPEEEPFMVGYVFAGWLLDGKEYDFTTPVTKDITLMPKWIESGKTAVSVSYSKLYVIELNKDEKVYLAAYDKDGALVGIYVDTIDGTYFPQTYSKSFADIGFSTDGVSKVSAYLWGENMQPLCDKTFINLK